MRQFIESYYYTEGDKDDKERNNETTQLLHR
jgi:hypothetical protein